MNRITYGPFLVRWTCTRCGTHVAYAFGLSHCGKCGVGELSIKTIRRQVTVKRSWWRKAETFWQVAR